MVIGKKYAVFVGAAAFGYIHVATMLSNRTPNTASVGSTAVLVSLTNGGNGYNPPTNEVEGNSGGETKSPSESGPGEEAKSGEYPGTDSAKGKEEGARDSEKISEDYASEAESEPDFGNETCNEAAGTPAGWEESSGVDAWRKYGETY
jgi:hypothetical protein